MTIALANAQRDAAFSTLVGELPVPARLKRPDQKSSCF